MFTVEGNEYDYDTAANYGITPDEDGNWPATVQIASRTEMILYGRRHPEYYEAVRKLRDEGKVIVRGSDSRMYAVVPYAPPASFTQSVKLRRANSA